MPNFQLFTDGPQYGQQKTSEQQSTAMIVHVEGFHPLVRPEGPDVDLRFRPATAPTAALKNLTGFLRDYILQNSN